MDELVGRVSHDATRGFYSAVISVTSELVDPVIAHLDDAPVELIAGGDEIERSAALALAIARQQMAHGFSDVGSDRGAERLRQLSQEVGRIASTLARLSSGPAVAPLAGGLEASTAAAVPPV